MRLHTTVTPRLVARWLGWPIAFLVFMNLLVLVFKAFGHSSLWGLAPFFTLDAEDNLPTLFSVVLWLLSAVLCLLIACLHARRGTPDLRWSGLAAITSFLALDEFASLHERLSEPMRKLLGYQNFYVAWIVPAGVFALVIGVLYARMVIGMPARARRMLIFSAVIFVGGSVGGELLGNWLDLHTATSMPYELSAIAEETMEMLGVALLVRSLVAYIEDIQSNITLSIGRDEPTSHQGSG